MSNSDETGAVAPQASDAGEHPADNGVAPLPGSPPGLPARDAPAADSTTTTTATTTATTGTAAAGPAARQPVRILQLRPRQ